MAENLANAGVGIDEDTAIVVEKGKSFYVLGSGAVYVFDGVDVSDTNIATEEELNNIGLSRGRAIAVKRPRRTNSH